MKKRVIIVTSAALSGCFVPEHHDHPAVNDLNRPPPPPMQQAPTYRYDQVQHPPSPPMQPDRNMNDPHRTQGTDYRDPPQFTPQGY